MRALADAIGLGKPISYTHAFTHSVGLTRPGLDPLLIGPYAHEYQANTIASGLRGQLHCTAHVPGTVVEVVGYDPTQPHLEASFTFFPSLRDKLGAIAVLAGTLAVLVFLIVLSRRQRE